MSTQQSVLDAGIDDARQELWTGRVGTWARSAAAGLGRSLIAYVAALVIFGAFVVARRADPLAMYSAMLSTLTSAYGLGQVLDKLGPFVLAALAVALPARAGLVNIGGEGQLVIGATAAGGVALALGTAVPGAPALIAMALAGAAAGAAWAGVAAVLKLAGNVSEAISTLLLNYVGADVLSYLVFGPWRDASGNGQPASRPLPVADMLPSLPGVPAHIGIALALAAVVLTALILARTRWGFSLRALGGNREAARRAGLPVAALTLSAMLAGGALAGLGGMIQFSGLEGQLRPGLAATFGYTGFLASWLGQHHPLRVTAAATLLAAIVVAGDSLQISSHLPGAAVNLLMGTVLLAVLGLRRSGA